ncbi:MAG: sodium-translocating pyrophosphatase [Armatimonadetes bacterium]|nr:sodium-translocating pyrophosphatase [Armatimonadota bacterium]
MMTAIWVVFISAIIGLIFGGVWYLAILREDPGSKGMVEVSKAVQEGAWAYLKKQMATMIWFVIIIALGLIFLYKDNPAYNIEGTAIPLYIGVAIAFVMGVAASYIAGLVGMMMAVQANCRVANAALTSYKKALYVAFRSGSVSGMATVGLGLMGACIVFFLFGNQSMKVLVGFGFGGCLAALFMRIGGGIYTKAADVGADLVGKVEKNIPEDDPRNAATIADNVGDNVGDCAGMAADVFESYEVTLVAAIILGAAASAAVGGGQAVLALVMYPLLIRAVGVFASIIGIYSVVGKDDLSMDPMKPINVGFWISGILAILGFFAVSWYVFEELHPISVNGTPVEWWKFAVANLTGVVLALVIEKLTEYFTATDKKPVTECAKSAKSGPATVILSGFGAGMESSVWSVVAICGAIGSSFLLFAGSTELAFYGVALSGLGLLATTGFMLAMDTYGPISDNANGIFEMSGVLKDPGTNPDAHKIVAKLDAVGNTTKALTKGLAIATAVIAATALFSSFMADTGLSAIEVNKPNVFIGLLIGGSVPFLFSSFAINAVSRAAFMLVEEVRRQFREIKGIMDYDPRSGSDVGKPDYQRCVAISTAAAQKELLSPAVLAVSAPILVAFGLSLISADPQGGFEALGGFLAGAILSGQLMAVMLSNTGGLWDNAKKKVEDGMFGGKGTEEHKATVVGDTVGDPFKDTAGPALNPLIKVMNLVALLLAPIVLSDMSAATRAIIAIIAIGALTGATLWSKRGSLDVDTTASTTPEMEEVTSTT